VPPPTIGTIRRSGERVLLRQGGDAGQPDQDEAGMTQKEPIRLGTLHAFVGFLAVGLDFSGRSDRMLKEGKVYRLNRSRPQAGRQDVAIRRVPAHSLADRDRGAR